MSARPKAADVLTATHPTLGRLFAAIDPDVRFVKPELSDSRLSAWLSPFPSVEAATAAIQTAGGALEGGEHG